MAESLEGSFSVDEFESNVLENAAAIPNVDNITTCSCRGYCLRGKGRNFCPCKSVNSFCSSVCHGDDFGCCMNNRRVQESGSEDMDSDFSMQENNSEDEEAEREGTSHDRGRVRELGMEQIGGRGGRERGGRGRGGRGRGGRGRGGRGRGGRGRGGRGRGGRGRGGRGRGGCGRGGRGRGGCGRGGQGRGHLVEEPNAAENQSKP